MSGKFSHSEAERCPRWETRLVATKHSSKRTNKVQVRCSQYRHHEGECSWHGVVFGIHAV